MFETLLCKTRLHLPSSSQPILSSRHKARHGSTSSERVNCLETKTYLIMTGASLSVSPNSASAKAALYILNGKNWFPEFPENEKKNWESCGFPFLFDFSVLFFFFFAWWCFLSFISSSSICMTAVIGHILPAHGDMRLLQAWIDWPALLYRETELVFSSHVALGVAWILSACSIYHVVGTKAEKRDNGHLMKNVECTYCISTNGISYQLQIQTNSMSWWKKIMVFFFFGLFIPQVFLHSCYVSSGHVKKKILIYASFFFKVKTRHILLLKPRKGEVCVPLIWFFFFFFKLSRRLTRSSMW